MERDSITTRIIFGSALAALALTGCASSLEQGLGEEHDRLLRRMDREADRADRAERARKARSKPGQTLRPGQAPGRGNAERGDRGRVAGRLSGPSDSGPHADQTAGRPQRNELTALLDLASRRSPALRAVLADWKAALAQIPQTRSLPEPTLGYGYYARSVETRVGPQRHRLSLSQKIPWIGKLTSRTKVALERAQVAKAAYFALVSKLFYQIKMAYYDLFYLERRREILAEHTKILASLETILRARMAVSLADQSQVVKLQVETAKTADLVRSSIERIQAGQAMLNGLLARDAATAVAVPRSLDRLPTSLPTARELAALARRSNPELILATRRIGLTQAMVREKRTSYLPDFTVSLTWIETGRSDMDAPDRGKDAVIIGLGVTLPIWVNKYRGEVTEARARVKAARARRDDLATRLDAAIFAAMARYRDALRRRRLYRRGLVLKAEQSLRTALQSYAVGKAGFLDVLDAERTLLAFSLETERATADMAKALAALELALGRPLPAGPRKGPTQTRSRGNQLVSQATNEGNASRSAGPNGHSRQDGPGRSNRKARTSHE